VAMRSTLVDELESVSRRDVDHSVPPPSGESSGTAAPAKSASVHASAADEQAEALAAELLESSERTESPAETAAESASPDPAGTGGGPEHGFAATPREDAAPAAPETDPVDKADGLFLDETEESESGETEAVAAHSVKPGSIEPQPDGSTLLDEKYVIRGSGTGDDPYQITWDLLTSASETYQPRLGMTELPQRVMMLNNKHVRITGYLAFPLAASESKEVLVMLNMWDGCCIGIPPSPYDALEVTLREALSFGNRRFLNYGSLTGVLKVDPFLQNEWLLGLYLVEDGVIDFGM
jgi:hypothetical protein